MAGAIGAVFDRGHYPEVGAGTSAGGIILGALASGRSPSDIKQIMLDLNFEDFISTGFAAKLRVAFKGCLSDGRALLKEFRKITGGKTFRNAGFDVRITGANYDTGRPAVFTRQTDPDMELALAMRITSAMPLAFSAVEYMGHWYKDGGVYAHIPVEASREPFRTVIFALAADPDKADHEKWAADAGIAREVGRTVDLLVDSNVHSELAKAPADSIRVFSDALGLGSFDFDLSRAQKNLLYAHGYDLMTVALKQSGL